MPVAIGLVVDHSVEVDEGVVPRGVAIAGHGALRLIPRIESRMAAGGRLPGGIIPHVLLVGLPVQAERRQLCADVLDVRWIDATFPCRDTAGKRRAVEGKGKACTTLDVSGAPGLMLVAAPAPLKVNPSARLLPYTGNAPIRLSNEWFSIITTMMWSKGIDAFAVPAGRCG